MARNLRWIISLCVVLTAGTLSWSQLARPSTPNRPAGQVVYPRNGLFIRPAEDETVSGGKSVRLEFPSDADMSTLKVVLNGKNVTRKFNSSTCGNNTCMDAVLSTQDGLRGPKNVLYATAKAGDGRLLSSRQRFDGEANNSVFSARSLVQAHDLNNDVPNLPTYSAFLPPSVSLTTNPNQSGYVFGNPWIFVGSQQKYPEATLNCSDWFYSVVVLDRHTLQEATPAACFANDNTLNAYLVSLKTSSPGSIVMMGTNYQKFTANNYLLDTTPIGGTNYSSFNHDTDYPYQYFVIGVAGANPGQAYENFNTWGNKDQLHQPFARGMFVEDITGKYNFIPSDSVEYVVVPNGRGNPDYAPFGMVQLGVPPDQATPTHTANIFLPPAPPQDTGGYWLLVVDRLTMQVVNSASGACQDSQAGAPPPNTVILSGCGAFYQTHNGDNQSLATSEYLRLASDLLNMDPRQMAILTTIGNAALAPGDTPSDYTVAATNDGNGNYGYWGNQNDNGGAGFFNAIKTLGGPPYATMKMWTDSAPSVVSAYSLIAARALGDTMNGHSVVSTTAYSQQGQTGYLHGIMTRDRFGWFRPSHNSQDDTFGSDSADFSMDHITSQQPVDWPELSTVLTGTPGGSLEGQQQAYRYISYLLISNVYLRHTVGHQDDLHYFFTGSLNSFIDYHTYDPAILPWVGTSSTFPTDCTVTGTTATCNFPAELNLPSATFTQADFNNVKAQMSNEVVALTNVVAFLSTGSVNMKDIVAAGNASIALEMIAAADTIQTAPDLKADSSSPVTLNSSNILGLASSVVDVGSTLATDGLISPELAPVVSGGLSILGSFLSGAGSVAGGLTQGGGDPNNLPSLDYTVQTTIGKMASSDLQGTLSAGFDTTSDNILSDWNKLSQLEALVTDTNNPSFYAPDQTVQNAAVQVFNRATQRSLFLSIFEAGFQVHFWPQVVGRLMEEPAPGTSYYPSEGGQSNGCHAFYYFATNSVVPYSYAVYPSPSPLGSPFEQYGGIHDGYVLAVGITNGGTGRAYSGNPTQNVTLLGFGNAPGQLNLPEEPFVIQGGPMNQAGKWLDMSQGGGNPDVDSTNPAGFYNSDICDAFDGVGGQEGNPGQPPSSRIQTTTTLTAPTSIVLRETLPLSVKVTATDGSTPSGTIAFYQGDNKLYETTLNATGSASYTVSGLNLGTFPFVAYYTTNKTYKASQSEETFVTVYATSPDMALSLSTRTLPVTYGRTSGPVSFQVTPKNGLAGAVEFSCSGLPSGLACSFNPAQALVAPGGVSTSFTIITTKSQTARLGMPENFNLATLGLMFGFVSIPGVFSLSALRKKARNKNIRRVLWLAPVLLLVALVGCGGGSGGNGGGGHETGPHTILVNATQGSLTRSITLTLNIQ
ncbi:MAG: Ig-like domain repeat protein [Acidobacteria bacterium]|nr:Ig-like domain repeat protein [Acidobacteriota bacterium]